MRAKSIRSQCSHARLRSEHEAHQLHRNRQVRRPLPPIRGESKPLQQSTGTADRRQAQHAHDRLAASRWEQDRLGVKPRHTWEEAVLRWLLETKDKATHGGDKSKLRWLDTHLGGLGLSSRLLARHGKRHYGVVPKAQLGLLACLLVSIDPYGQRRSIERLDSERDHGRALFMPVRRRQSLPTRLASLRTSRSKPNCAPASVKFSGDG